MMRSDLDLHQILMTHTASKFRGNPFISCFHAMILFMNGMSMGCAPAAVNKNIVSIGKENGLKTRC